MNLRAHSTIYVMETLENEYHLKVMILDPHWYTSSRDCQYWLAIGQSDDQIQPSSAQPLLTDLLSRSLASPRSTPQSHELEFGNKKFLLI